jgi:hypothetical protein
MQERKRGISTQKQRPQLTLQEKALRMIKKFFLEGASVRNQEDCIKINVFVLVDRDLEFFKELEGMYRDIMIKRSGRGLVVILNFGIIVPENFNS